MSSIRPVRIYRTVGVCRTSSTQPLVHFTKSISDKGPVVPLYGEVWISVSAFDSSRSGYIGLSTTSGTVAFKDGTDVSVDPIITDGSFELSADLPVVPGGGTPEKVKLTFLSNAILFYAENVHFDYFGHTFNLHYTQDQPVYDANSIRFPYADNAERFSANEYGFASFSGESAVMSSSWSLPITNGIVPGTSGVGELLISFAAGLRLMWPGSNVYANVGECYVLASSNKVTFISDMTSASLSQRVDLWDESLVYMTFNKPFRLVYTKSTDYETIVIVVLVDANISRPLTVNGERISFTANAGTVEFSRSESKIGFRLHADVERSDYSQSFCIKNMVISTSRALRWNVFGSFSAGKITTGSSEMLFDVNYLLPILPDPYASRVFVEEDTSTSTGLYAMSVATDWDITAKPSIHVSIQNVAKLLPRSLLMDLSTNSSMFGAAILRDRTSRTKYGIVDLSLASNRVFIATQPLVQWEPVKVDAIPVQFGNCGGPSYFVADIQDMVPIIPKYMVDAFVHAPHVEARFTLPFGMEAIADIPLGSATITGITRPYVGQLSPTFKDVGAEGGYQITIESTPFTQQATIPGYAEQTEVFDSAFVTFNDRFGSKSNERGIPLKRIDISGFGESMFSDWQDTTHPPPTISKALFNVAIGRASQEVIQAYLVEYVEGVRMVHTMKIERSNNGTVSLQKKDSWKAVSDGYYDLAGSGIVVHPGIVKGISNVRNIRETGRTHNVDGISLTEVEFYCEVDIDNVESGNSFVPSNDYKGFVQLNASTSNTGPTPQPASSLLSPQQLADLIVTMGGSGGTVDCIVNVGGLRCRISKIEVGVSHGPNGDPEFVVAAYGSPLFPKGLQWSTLIRNYGNFEVVDTVPIVKVGAQYAFADPNYALLPPSPSAEYCVMCATGTQRIAFSGLQIDSNVITGRNGFVADPYALGSSIGVFPMAKACIPFSNYSINISSSGDMTLNLQKFPTGNLKRTIYESDVSSSYTYCNNATNVSIGIDTSSPVAAYLQITSFALAFESGGSEILRTVGDLIASSAEPTRLDNSKVEYGPSLQDSVIEKVPLLNYIKDFMPSPQVTTNNSEFNIIVSAKVNLDGITKKSSIPGPIKTFVQTFVIDLSIGQKAKLSKTQASIDVGFSAALNFPTPWSYFTPSGSLQGIVGIAMFTSRFRAGSSDKLITVGLGVGIGFKATFAGFKAVGFFAVSFEVSQPLGGSNTYGYAGSVVIKGSIDLLVVTFSLSIEARYEILTVKCAPPGAPAGALQNQKTSYGITQATVAIDVSMFAILSIDLNFQFQWIQVTEAGPCALPFT